MDFTLIYTTYFEKLVRFAKQFVDYQEDAENIAQDIFVSLLEKPELIDNIENLNAYLYKSVKNRCLDFIQQALLHKKYRTNAQSDYLQELEIASCARNYHRDSLETVEHNVNNAINTLPPRCREVFLLSRYDGLKYREISQYLGLSVNTVDAQMCIALNRLRQQLSYYLCA